jgi:Tfp pilus assembly protein PilX
MTKASGTMGSKAKGIETMGIQGMKRARLHTRGFTLIASLLMLLLLSGIAIGLLMMVNTEGKVGGTDLQNNIAYHVAEGGIEKMSSDLGSVIQNAQSPSTSAICNVGSTANQPSMTGVTWTQYLVQPTSGCGTSAPSNPTSVPGTVNAGPYQGLWAQVIPISMQVTAALPGGQEVSMMRSAQIALIPVFQFGVFSESDLSYFAGSNLDFVGPAHTNGDLYLFAGTGANLTFHSKVTAYGNVVRTQLANGYGAGTNYTGNVFIPSADGDCSTPGTVVTGVCSQMAAVGTSYGDGSVTGAGSSTAQSSANYNGTAWNSFSSSTNNELINGNYWTATATTPAGTGATKLSMPFVGGGALPNEIIRRPPSGEASTSAIGQSREYNMAQIRVLLSDDPNDLPGGASDSNNIRLANVPANSAGTGYNLPYGIATSTPATGTTILPALASGSTYNMYFATASNAIPAGTCTSTYNASSPNNPTVVCPADWPFPPAPWTSTVNSPSPLLVPNGAPYIYGSDAAIPSTAPVAPALSAGASTVVPPTFTPCPTPTMNYSGTNYAPLAAAVSSVCPTSPYNSAGPYYYLTGYANGGSTSSSALGSNITPETYLSSTWNLIDGWLRVEYSPGAGSAFVPVTMEWLQLGFARGPLPPTSPGTNPINPNAILLLQEPADRMTAIPATPPTICTSGTSCSGAVLSSSATAPVCTATSGSGASTKCAAWSSTPPQLLADPASPSPTATATIPGMSWTYGVTTSTMKSVPGNAASTLQSQSPTRFNWYPINFYDVREGEVRDNTVADNSCSTNGVMNAVEIDVGNLAKWLAGSITGTSGSSVDFNAQNGYILYFSDRRGMLLNPHPPLGGSATKTGDAGTEDVINRASGPGVPDGALEAIPANRTISPEDDNENGYLDNFGPGNMGLGFYGTIASPGTATTSGKNQNTQINSGTSPNPFGADAAGDTNNRIASCGTTARKNWVSGARHVLRLVDGSLGNVPRRTDSGATLDSPGGFTVASENPVYIWGDYNTNASDASGWAGDTTKFQGDVTGHSAASVIADAVTLLSVDWNDLSSTLGSTAGSNQVTDQNNRNPSHDGHFRLAIAGGKNINFQQPTYTTPAAPGNDFGTDGGVHNFLRYLENWSGQTMYYKGSMVSLFYATYNTGTFKCCTDVYGVPARAFYFDLDFTSPGGLPPGTPMFRDVETLSYRQVFTPRTSSQ